MKALDKFLQNARIKQARRFINKNDIVLDIGSVDGVMFEKWKGYISIGVGIDPTLVNQISTDYYELYPGYFPDACPKDMKFNSITMLAVLEHIPIEQQSKIAKACHDYLLPKGRLIITVPSPQVDRILEILLTLKLIEGMSLEEHYGFKPENTEKIFGGVNLKLIHQGKFQFGLNNLFVFERP
jgi:hypothetical protein